MKYLFQFAWIALFSFLGECLHMLIPFPIPASIYGLVLLFAALSLKLLRPEQVEGTGHFLVNIMGVMFVCPAVGMLDCMEIVRSNALGILAVTVVSLLLTFFVSGRVTQFFLKREEDRHA